MAHLRTTSFVGQPSTLATPQIVASSNYDVVFAVSGPNSAEIVRQVSEKLRRSEADSPTSFLSLIERSREQWSDLYGELAAVFTFEDKMYLLVQNGEIWLKRSEKFGRVLKSSEELKVVEGQIHEHDEYVVMTQSATIAIGRLFSQVIEGTLSFLDMQSHLQDEIHSSGLPDRCAVSIVEVSSVESLPVPSVSTAADVPLPLPPARSIQIGKQLASVRNGITKALHFGKVLIKKTPELLVRLKSLRNSQISREQRKKIAIGLLLLCVTGLIVAGFFVFRSILIHQGETFLQPFELKLSSLQQLANSDTVLARDQVLVMQKEYESQRINLKTNVFVQSSLDDFSTQLANFVKDVSGKVELQTLPIFYDFRLVRADFLASKADVDQNTAIFMDSEKQTAIALTIDTKQQTVLPIGQYPTLKDLSFSSEKLYLLADGVYQFPIDSQKPAEKIIPEGDSNREGVFVRSFGDFVYVFNAEKRNLYRYSLNNTENETPQPIGWFQDKKDLDFPSITSFAIDGNVWLGTQQGKILRYERGNPVSFNVNGLQEPFSSSIKIYTKEDLDSIFVLESAKNRVVRLSKDGTFIRQIQSPSLGAATDVIFSPLTNKAYALAGSLVYELAL